VRRRLQNVWSDPLAVGLAHSFLGASKEEWSLVRRHPSEKMFGAQIAGSKPALLVPTAEIIARECKGVDFVDLNCGCPIDLVYKSGSGSACTPVPSHLQPPADGGFSA
jgi:tRNA-dihydrouridine synthase 3